MKEVKLIISKVVDGTAHYIMETSLVVLQTADINNATVFNSEDDARRFMQKHSIMNWNITPYYITPQPIKK